MHAATIPQSKEVVKFEHDLDGVFIQLVKVTAVLPNKVHFLWLPSKIMKMKDHFVYWKQHFTLKNISEPNLQALKYIH